MSDNKVTLDQLDNSAIEAMTSSVGDVSTLNTENKTIVGALAEIVGKKEIANAIGEPLTASDTFGEMGNEINGLLSQFKTNMMNSGVVVESGDKFKQLIDKIQGLTEGEDTTLRDSLASILGDKGIDVSDEDDMASLITKTSGLRYVEIISGPQNIIYTYSGNICNNGETGSHTIGSDCEILSKDKGLLVKSMTVNVYIVGNGGAWSSNIDSVSIKLNDTVIHRASSTIAAGSTTTISCVVNEVKPSDVITVTIGSLVTGSCTANKITVSYGYQL